MNLINANTLAKWLPCPPASGLSLDAAIMSAMAWAEGPLGANRPLGLTPFVEEVTSTTDIFRLSYVPIAAEPEPVFRLRVAGTGRDTFNRPLGSGSLVELSPDQYAIDLVRGEVRIISGGTVASWQPAGIYAYGGRDPLAPRPRAQLVAEYTSGFEAGSLALEQTIYPAIAQLVNYLASPSATGVAEIRVQNEFQLRYGNATGGYTGVFGAGIGQVPEALLLPFQRFRPRAQGVM